MGENRERSKCGCFVFETTDDYSALEGVLLKQKISYEMRADDYLGGFFTGRALDPMFLIPPVDEVKTVIAATMAPRLSSSSSSSCGPRTGVESRGGGILKNIGFGAAAANMGGVPTNYKNYADAASGGASPTSTSNPGSCTYLGIPVQEVVPGPGPQRGVSSNFCASSATAKTTLRLAASTAAISDRLDVASAAGVKGSSTSAEVAGDRSRAGAIASFLDSRPVTWPPENLGDGLRDVESWLFKSLLTWHVIFHPEEDKQGHPEFAAATEQATAAGTAAAAAELFAVSGGTSSAGGAAGASAVSASAAAPQESSTLSSSASNTMKQSLAKLNRTPKPIPGVPRVVQRENPWTWHPLFHLIDALKRPKEANRGFAPEKYSYLENWGLAMGEESLCKDGYVKAKRHFPKGMCPGGRVCFWRELGTYLVL